MWIDTRVVAGAVRRCAQQLGEWRPGRGAGRDSVPDSLVRRSLAIMWYGLAGLWLVDGLLQLQPEMFSMDMVSQIMQPTAIAQPGWITGPVNWTISLWSAAPAFWNATVAILELAIAFGMLIRGRAYWWGRAALWVSIGWGLVIWYLGEGLGGLFTGAATFVSGAPGSVILYVAVAAILLIPERHWTNGRLFSTLRSGTGGLWLLGAALQFAPVYWTPFGLSTMLQSVAMMKQPLHLSSLDYSLVNAMGAAPVAWNLALIIIMGTLGLALLTGRDGWLIYTLAGAFLLFLWGPCQGFGMIFTGMTTDPNTPPLLALLMVPCALASWHSSRSVRSKLPVLRQALNV